MATEWVEEKTLGEWTLEIGDATAHVCLEHDPTGGVFTPDKPRFYFYCEGSVGEFEVRSKFGSHGDLINAQREARKVCLRLATLLDREKKAFLRGGVHA